MSDEKYDVLELTPSSWLYKIYGEASGFLYKTNDVYTWVTPLEKNDFYNFADFQAWFISQLKYITPSSNEQSKEKLDSLNNIDGYPVKHDRISVISGGDMPIYTKGGAAKHVAGHWAIKFGDKWVPSFCPLLTTIEKHDSSGPFKERSDMMSDIVMKNQSEKFVK